MKLTKLENKSILLTPQTAMEENFIWYLMEMINAKEALFLSDLAVRRALVAQDFSLSKEVLES